ncbi:hypothetical protein [Desulfosarcina ovata]|uniref:Uncharacterized protein n=1 Tax=Desulfosarcina ovata subsp. ovata TaxID=2752305 RepID=A0A5K8A4H0_9BACT|nr:hypothetical protein [Desulfosarcina ovata]BBO87190.1 hypothetical protein DSCOOX_03700 [Desulfosarcina ovata subsp. ovata]
MDKKANDTFAFDLENRLDDFFSDELPPQENPAAEPAAAKVSELPLEDLKSTILAIDWEITDDALDAFIHQVDKLADRYSADKVIQSLLKILKSLGKYIRQKKSNAHPDTIKRIMAVYSTLEAVVGNDDLSQTEKKQLLQEEVNQFKMLKAKIVERKPASSAAPQAPKANAATGIEAVIQAIDDLKSLMVTELDAIRKEIGQLRKK